MSNIVKGSGILYTTGIPNTIPQTSHDAEFAIDVNGNQYAWNRTTSVWDNLGQGIEIATSSIAPTHVPSNFRPRFVVTPNRDLYFYSGSWGTIGNLPSGIVSSSGQFAVAGIYSGSNVVPVGTAARLTSSGSWSSTFKNSLLFNATGSNEIASQVRSNKFGLEGHRRPISGNGLNGFIGFENTSTGSVYPQMSFEYGTTVTRDGVSQIILKNDLVETRANAVSMSLKSTYPYSSLKLSQNQTGLSQFEDDDVVNIGGLGKYLQLNVVPTASLSTRVFGVDTEIGGSSSVSIGGGALSQILVNPSSMEINTPTITYGDVTDAIVEYYGDSVRYLYLTSIGSGEKVEWIHNYEPNSYGLVNKWSGIYCVDNHSEIESIIGYFDKTPQLVSIDSFGNKSEVINDITNIQIKKMVNNSNYSTITLTSGIDFLVEEPPTVSKRFTITPGSGFNFEGLVTITKGTFADVSGSAAYAAIASSSLYIWENDTTSPYPKYIMIK